MNVQPTIVNFLAHNPIKKNRKFPLNWLPALDPEIFPKALTFRLQELPKPGISAKTK
jgi:hypothetical protein